MKVSKKLKSLLEALANTSKKSRELNRKIQVEFDKLGVNTDTVEFANAYGYIDGDCDISPIIDYIENEVTRNDT